MTAEKADHQHAITILNHGDQAVVIGLDVEHHTSAFQDARLGMRSLHLLWRPPVRSLRNRQPCPVLSARRIDTPMTRALGKIALNNVSADHQHERILPWISQKWKRLFPF